MVKPTWMARDGDSIKPSNCLSAKMQITTAFVNELAIFEDTH